MGSNAFSKCFENTFSDCPLADECKDFSPEKIDVAVLDKPIAHNPDAVKNFADVIDNPEKCKPIQNKIDGLRREDEVCRDLEKQYTLEAGCEIIREAYLRDEQGNILKDPETGKARRVDFLVVKDGQIVDSIEVTSKTADKSGQLAKENRIRDIGGNYIFDASDNLIKFPGNIYTRVERRD